MNNLLTLSAAAIIGLFPAASFAGSHVHGGASFSGGGISIVVGSNHGFHSSGPIHSRYNSGYCESPTVIIPQGTHHYDVIRHGNHTHTIHHHGGHIVTADKVHGNHVHVGKSNRGGNHGHSNHHH